MYSIMAFLYLINCHGARFLRPVDVVAKVEQFGVAVIRTCRRSKTRRPRPVPSSRKARMGKPDCRQHRRRRGGARRGSRGAGHRAATGSSDSVPRVGDLSPSTNRSSGCTAAPAASTTDVAGVGRARRRAHDGAGSDLFRVLVDIAIKALSAAINDPTTAVMAIDELHRLLRLVGLRDLRGEELRDAAGELRLVFRTRTGKTTCTSLAPKSGIAAPAASR